MKAIQVGLSCAVLALHHDKKGLAGEERGSGALGGGADVMISLRVETDSKDSPIVVKVHKTKDDAQPEPVRFVRRVADLGPSRDPDAEPGERETSCFLEQLCDGSRPAVRPGLRDVGEQAIVEYLEALPVGEKKISAQVFAVVKRSGLQETAFHKRLSALVKRGLVESDKASRTPRYSVRRGTNHDPSA